jgi:hypothetical protein
LESLNLKNGVANTKSNSNFSDNPSLEFVCIDEEDIGLINDELDPISFPLLNISSGDECEIGYGVFMGEVYYSNDNCETKTSQVGQAKVSLEKSDKSRIAIADRDGNYFIRTPLEVYYISVEAIDEELFSISPQNIELAATQVNNIINQDFCIEAKIEKTDTKVTMFANSEFRPGFDTDLTIICENLGSVEVSTFLDFNFMGNLMQVESSDPVATELSESNLRWIISNLSPLEKRIITVTVRLNSPMDNIPLTGGEEIQFTADLEVVEDENNNNNNFVRFTDQVVNSFDPNDKQAFPTGYGDEHYIL